jgi:microcystin-dependent protein
MSTINKICLFAGMHNNPCNWKICDGKNGMPKLDPLKLGNGPYSPSISYICCVSDEYYAEEPLIAQVLKFTGNFAPQGWAFCDGSKMNISNHSALFSLLGTQFGGDGMNTFALPKIADIPNPYDASKPPIRYIICLEGQYPRRE